MSTAPIVSTIYGRPREFALWTKGVKGFFDPPAPAHDQRDTVVDPGANRMLVSGPHFYLAQLACPVDAALLGQAGGEIIFVPLSAGCVVAGEDVKLGEAVLLTDAAQIELDDGARALLAQLLALCRG